MGLDSWPMVQLNPAVLSSEILATQPPLSALYRHCVCVRGRPAGLSALTSQAAADATTVSQQLSKSAVVYNYVVDCKHIV